MFIKVGINGFGRIGRVIFRTCLQRSGFEVAAINDPAIDIEYICYLIKFDSTHGKFKGTVSFSGNEITINGQRVRIFQEKLPANIPWFCVGVQYVIEASGMFTNVDKASGHLKSFGVKRVIITAPSADVPMLIVGVNEDMIGVEHTVLSCASSTLYCLAPIVKILEDNFGVTEGFVTSIHAMTPSLKALDGLCLRGKHWRDHRSIHQNIIPAATGACKALNKIIPQIKDKLSGLAFRVPIVNVSVLDMSIRLNMNTSLDEIMKCIKSYSSTIMKDILKISNEQCVSSDFLGEEHSCIIDANSSIQLSPNFFKLVCWYENEYSYACRVLDIILFSEKQFDCGFLPLNFESRSSKGTTTERCKSIFIPNNYHFDINPNMISSASQDTGFKMKILPKNLKNNALGLKHSPTTETTLNRVVKKTNEALKMYKNIDINSEKETGHNASSFFQSCIQFAPTNVARNKFMKNQEELQRIKKEFSKIVNLTENLLQKSSESKNEFNKLDQVMSEKESKESHEVTATESQNNYSKVEIKTTDPKKENNDINLAENVDLITDKLLVKTVENIKPNSDINKNKTCLDEALQVPPIQNSSNNKSNTNFKVIHTICEITSLPSISEVAISEKCFTNEINKSEKELCNTKLIGQQKEIICNVVQVINNDDIIDSKIESSDNSIVADKVKIEANSNNEIEDKTSLKDCVNIKNDIEIDQQVSNDLQKKQRILESILQKFSKNRLQVSSDTSRCNSSCFSSLTNARIRRKPDIYDKLDSVSGSGSENSFDINERKSQVINITDLTNSIEDLARLDKICRIIEISDELSDKLFCELNNSECLSRKETWSFKDLCERIKLDEFCNKVFGQ